MKMRNRSLLSMVLVTMLIVCQTVPAMASSGNGYYGSYYYQWSVTKTQTIGRAHISTPSTPTYIGAHVTNYLYCNACGDVAIVDSGRDEDNFMSPTYGYASVTASLSNVFTNASGSHTARIDDTQGSFKFQAQDKYDWLILHRSA